MCWGVMQSQRDPWEFASCDVSAWCIETTAKPEKHRLDHREPRIQGTAQVLTGKGARGTQ